MLGTKIVSGNIQLRAALLVLILIISSGIVAASGGKIVGRVVDKENGQPLIGASVYIKSAAVGATADLNGEFTILNVSPGNYSITVSYVSYESVTVTDVNVVTNHTTTINFELASSAIEQKEVVIKATRPRVVKDQTSSEQIINAKVLSQTYAKTIPEALETQTGIFEGYFRGSSQVQALYMLDGIGINSGLFSDNYTGLNTTTIQEISVQTGGYNAEYGEARSAIINVSTKSSSDAIHGTALYRMRPPGIYHFGPNMYSESNYDWTHFDLSYWMAQTNDPNSAYYKQEPNALLQLWRQQITANDTLKNYNKRIDYEAEGTIYGPITEGLTFLFSGRYAKHVNIFPQAIPYNPEFNLQGYLDYRINSNFQLKVSGLYGGYESAEKLSTTNWNTTESAQEAQWYEPMEVTDPYQQNKYALLGSFLYQWPEKRRWTQVTSELTYVISPETFLKTSFSYLDDNMDRSDRFGAVPDSLYSHKDDKNKMIYFLDHGYMHAYDKTFSKVLMLKSDFTSQVTKNHLVKAGLEFKKYDFSERHFMIEYKGGGRENFVNIFDGKPYEGDFYIQDKMEFSGMVVNAGIRVDFFNQNREAPKNMFDPLAYELTTPGHDPNEPYGYPGTPEREKTKLQVAVSPRIGISHPIDENTVLHFEYGHFYQRPSWSKMFGFPTVSYTENDSAALDQYGNQTTYMEEWHGYLGNPDLTFEKTIQYEIGIKYNILGLMLLDVTGYYKDASQETGFNSITGVYPATHFANKPLMVSNGGYSDVRGIESRLDTRFNSFLNGGLSYDIYWSWDGVVGYSRLYEPGSGMTDIPKGVRDGKSTWSGYHKIKAWVTLDLPKDFGPEVFGVKPLSDVMANVFFWWRSGDPYTYHGPGDLSTKPNNMTWFNYYEINLKLAKGFEVFDNRLEFSVNVENLLDSKFLRMLYGDDMIRWQQRTDLSEEQRLPKNSFSNEPDVWNWYTYEVPPRQMYFQVRYDF